MSRLAQRLAQLEAHNTRTTTAAKVAAHLLDAGDAFELAARAALGAPDARVVVPDECDDFDRGYSTACAELAVVLRAMRAGAPPTPEAMAEARASVAT